MPGSYRSTWKVTFEDGHNAEYTALVTTSARDQAAIVLPTGPDGAPQFSMGVVLQILHNALCRTETPNVPRKYEDFLDALVEAEEVGADLPVDPIPTAPSDA